MFVAASEITQKFDTPSEFVFVSWGPNSLGQCHFLPIKGAQARYQWYQICQNFTTLAKFCTSLAKF